jgi:hypothetical protein
MRGVAPFFGRYQTPFSGTEKVVTLKLTGKGIDRLPEKSRGFYLAYPRYP